MSNDDVSRQISAVNLGRRQTTADLLLEFDPNMIIKFAEGDGNAMDGSESHSKDSKLKHLIITVSLFLFIYFSTLKSLYLCMLPTRVHLEVERVRWPK